MIPAAKSMDPMAKKVFQQPIKGDTRSKPKAPPKPKGGGGKVNPEAFQRPIPGQSLTAAPKSRPYERPPEISDPEEALRYHLTRLNNVDALETVVAVLQKGIDVKTLTTGILRAGQAEGIHSIDVSLGIASAIHEYITTVADEVGIDYETGFEADAGEENDKEMALVETMLDDMDDSEPEMEAEQVVAEEEPQMEMDLGKPEAAPRGLMARA